MIKNYNATVAKIMAMYGKRLTAQDYTELMNRQTVADAADYLKKNTHYAPALAAIDTNTVHRGMLEDLLHKSVFETYMRITGFENISRQEFYNYKIIQTEIDEITRFIRCLNAGSEKFVQGVPVYINKYTSIDLLEMAKAGSFAELLKFLEKTPYYEPLRAVRPDENGLVDVTECETRLRTYFFIMLKKSMHFKSVDEERLNDFIETDIDLINLINSYRLKTYFGAEEDTIEEDMLPFSGRLTPEKRRELGGTADEEEFVRKFSKTYYGRQMVKFGYDPADLEQSARKLRHKYAASMLRSSASAPLSVYAFMFLLETEVQNVISIIEGIRYGVDPVKISELIIV